MTPDDESRTDVAWREIVENYGERVSLDPEEPTAPEPAPGAPPESAYPAPVEDKIEHFTPPTPGPVPLPATWQRRLAWAGVFGAPLVGLVLALFSVYVAPLINWALVAWFIGGFGYLVATMSQEPRDPWDDGSRV